MEDYKKILQIEVHNIVDRLQNGLIHPYTAKQEIFKSTLKAINYTRCCKSDSEKLCEVCNNDQVFETEDGFIANCPRCN